MFSLEYTTFAVWAFSWCPDPETYIEKQVFFATEVLALDKARKPSNLDENEQEKCNKKCCIPQLSTPPSLDVARPRVTRK